MLTTDVLIIGAGIAGLGAARHLLEQGYRVTLLEARERPGGRIVTCEHAIPGSINRPGEPAAWSELGAEFVHGMEPHLLALFDEAGLLLNEVLGTPYFMRSGKLVNISEDESDKIFAALYNYEGPDCSASEFLQQHFAGERWQEARAQVSEYLEGFNAARLNDVSVHWIQQGLQAGDDIHEDRQFRCLHGYSRLVAWLVQQVGASNIVYDQEVQRIDWSPGQTKVQTRTPAGEIHDWLARAVLVTVPLGVWQAAPGEPGVIAFTPDLPEKRRAASDLRMGVAMRVVFHFDSLFWEQEGEQGRTAMTGLSFLRSDDPLFSVWWTQSPLHSPTLTAWIGGSHAEPLGNDDETTLIERALESLSRIMSRPVAELKRHLLYSATHNWSRDPYSRGAYSYIPVDGLDAPAKLAVPVENTLFFAGEATDTHGFTGTVHAALLTGYRAATEIMACCGKS